MTFSGPAGLPFVLGPTLPVGLDAGLRLGNGLPTAELGGRNNIRSQTPAPLLDPQVGAAREPVVGSRRLLRGS